MIWKLHDLMLKYSEFTNGTREREKTHIQSIHFSTPFTILFATTFIVFSHYRLVTFEMFRSVLCLTTHCKCIKYYIYTQYVFYNQIVVHLYAMYCITPPTISHHYGIPRCANAYYTFILSVS